MKVRFTYYKGFQGDENLNIYTDFIKEKHPNDEIELVESTDFEVSEYFMVEMFENEEQVGEGLCPYKSTEEVQKQLEKE